MSTSKLLVAAGLAVALSTPPAEASRVLRPERIAPKPTWSGPQFIGADTQGKVYLLRADTFEVYPVTTKGLGEPVVLETEPLAKNEGRLDAAMSSSGDWVIRDGNGVRFFRDGEEKRLAPLNWELTKVGFLRNEPIAAVGPTPISRFGVKVPDTPPLVLTWGGDEWQPLISERASDRAAPGHGLAWLQETGVTTATDRQGRLWVANTYRYRVRRFSPSGRELLSIVVGDGEVKHRKDTAALEKGFAAQVKRSGVAHAEKGKARAFTAVPAVVALTEGRDGKMYFLVHSEAQGSSFVLDRYDPVTGSLQRARLGVEYSGRMSLAAGKDGLYLASFDGESARYRLAWSALDEATWTDVEEAAIGSTSEAAEAAEESGGSELPPSFESAGCRLRMTPACRVPRCR